MSPQPNAAQPIADLMHTVTVTCGCGTEYDAPAILLGDRARPTQLYCPACSTRRAKDQQEAEAKRAAVSLAARREREQLDQDRAAERRREAIAEARGQLAVPPLYADASLDTFQYHGSPSDQAAQRAVVATGRDYLARFPKVNPLLVCIGAPGSGKGHLAWSLARGIVEAGHRAGVVKLGDLVRELRSSWGQSGDRSGDLALEHYRRLDFLVVDEVSRHAFYGQPVQHLYDVLDHRLEQLRPTILTSNEGDEGLRAILSPALWNRIEGHGGVLEFGTASWRSRPR